MNTEKKIEICLKAAPKPPAPSGLQDRLQRNVTLGQAQGLRTVLSRWFAPSGGHISPWRAAAAAVIAVVVLLPLSYGATKAVKYAITTFEAEFEYGDNAEYRVSTTVTTSGENIQNQEEARQAEQEFYGLYKGGKAEEVQPDVWVTTLANGEKFAFSGDPDSLGLSEAERKELLKEQFDQINELREAGKYERTFIKEIEKDGVRIRLYRDTFTLSNGKIVALTSGVEQ